MSRILPILNQIESWTITVFFKPVNGGIIGVCEVNGTYQRCVEPEINGSCAAGLQLNFQICFIQSLELTPKHDLAIRSIKKHRPIRDRADNIILKIRPSVLNTRVLTSMNV